MAFRFRHSFKIAPVLTLNISKSGVSMSIGTRGACATVVHGKMRTTFGLPGTGVSYTIAGPRGQADILFLDTFVRFQAL